MATIHLPPRSLLLLILFLLACTAGNPFGISIPSLNEERTKLVVGSSGITTIATRPLPQKYRSLPRPAALSLHSTVSSSSQQQSSQLSPKQQQQQQQQQHYRNGEYGSSLVSKLTYRYASPLLRIARKRSLTQNDAFRIPEEQTMENVVTSLYDVYRNTMTREAMKKNERGGGGKVNHSFVLAKSILLHQRRTLLLTGLLRLLNTTIQAFPALLVSRLLRTIENSAPPQTSLLTALSLISVLSLKMLVENQYFHNVVKCATQVRGALSGLIFDKSLRLPANGDGKVLNLMQSDTSTMESVALQLHTIWDGPLQIAIYTSLLYKYLGPSVIWGILVLCFTIPMNSVTLRITNKLSKKENEARDDRTKRTSEAIGNMKLVKLQGWEHEFSNSITQSRTLELTRHKRRGAIRALNSAISNAIPAITLVVTLMAYAKTGRPIVASTIFTAISLFNQLRFPLFFYPMLIDSLANGKNALQRISDYLSCEEITPYVRTAETGDEEGLEMKNGNFLWRPDGPPALCNANFCVKRGEIVAVIGPVGTGKTALMKGTLGELSPVPASCVTDLHLGRRHDDDDDGGETKRVWNTVPEVTIGDKKGIGYCAQEAWLNKGTLRDSILFGRAYNETKYLQVLFDAGLDRDLLDGTLRHETDVGEGGSNLSGGQRARVALARTLYGDAGVYLLDDPLSALDASVGSMVFERVVGRLKREKKAVVFVTNDPNLPRRCDRVMLMGRSESGCSTIVDVGKYDELIGRGYDLKSFTVEETEEEEEEEVALKEEELVISLGDTQIRVDMNDTCAINTCHADPDCRVMYENSPDHLGEHVISTTPDVNGKEDDHIDISIFKDAGELIEIQDEKISSLKKTTQLKPSSTKIASTDDTMSTSAVPLKTYLSYFHSIKSPLLILLTISSYLLANSCQFFQQYTISKWTSLPMTSQALSTQYLEKLIYAALLVSVALYSRSYLFMLSGVRASSTLHSRMLSALFKAPISFFSSTPSGQLLTRFGKEMETIDRSLPDGISSVIYCFLQIAFSILALTGSVSPLLFLPIGIVGIFYGTTMSRFRPAARDLKRWESKSRSPIYTHFKEALKGSETIRSIPNGVSFWSRQHRSLTDTNLGIFGSVKALDRWLSVRLETLGNTMVLAAAVASVYLAKMGKLQAGQAGWGITQSLSITGLMAWAVRCLTDLETQMMSVLRVSEISGENMPKELSGVGDALKPVKGWNSTKFVPAPRTDEALLKSGWPWKGEIKFKNISMRYNPSSPLVLRNVTIDVLPGTTLGVVGRTGSGKSSLLFTLFRLVELEGGSIEIDGVDIRSISLRALRKSLSIIPQNPVLFTGDLMFNLDATLTSTPELAMEALNSASPALNQTLSLSSPILENGSNLSLGQRQLICLARALLRNTKILVLDEATSSVDTQTDAQVQATIRDEFVKKGVTVITVAHRLDTVLGYDKIVVLGDGEVVEYGSPKELLKKSDGELRKLVDADLRSRRLGAGKKVIKVPLAQGV